MLKSKNRNNQNKREQTKLGFIFILNKNNNDTLNLLSESIVKLKKEYLPFSAFFLISAEAHNLKITIPPDLKNNLLTPSECSDIISKERIDLFYLCTDTRKLNSTINFNDFFRNELDIPEKNEYAVVSWLNQPYNIFPGYLLNPASISYLLSLAVFSNTKYHSDLEYYIRSLNLKKKSVTINSDCPFSPLKKFSLENNLTGSIRRCFYWNISLPYHEIRKEKSFISSLNGTPVSRLIFSVISILVFILLPVISYNAGISGDEEKHYVHAEKVYNYFATAGKDKSAVEETNLKLNYYGQSFDLLSYLVIKVMNTDKIYEVRHVLNGITGALTILTAGLLARFVAGNIAGILTMLFLFFSPRFLGHSMNNPMDIPFALGYVFTILQIFRFLKRLPVFSNKIAALIILGIAFTISIRIGGLLLIPYLFVFSGLFLLLNRWPWKIFTSQWNRFVIKGLFVLIFISASGYFLSLIPWPYGLENPFKNPMEALRMMANIEVSLRVFFNGGIYWSDMLPWFYIPKNILISVPVIILAGFFLLTLLLPLWKNITQPYWLLILLFATVFPVLFVIYKESNVYGGWRHLIFIYPTMVVMSASAYKMFINMFENKFFRIAVVSIILLSLTGPAFHIIRNYPNQYIYFNQLAGGVKNAYKKYETDYYLVSLKNSADWLKENVLKEKRAQTEHPLRITSNAPTLIMEYYFKDYKEDVEILYTRYYDRGISDWDYAVFFCNYIDPYHIRKGIWPPKNSIFTADVDNVPVGAVVERVNRDDFEGISKTNQGIRERNMDFISEGIQQLEKAIEYDPHNEIAYLNLAQGYILTRRFDLARKKLDQLLNFYPHYDKAINMLGFSYLSEGDLFRDRMKVEKSIAFFNEVLKVNFKNSTSYYNLGLAYYILQDPQRSLEYLQKAIDFSPSYKEPYALIATIFEERGMHQEAERWRGYLQNL